MTLKRRASPSASERVNGADEVEEELAAAHGLVDERSLVLGETIAVGEEEPVQRGRQLVLREGG